METITPPPSMTGSFMATARTQKHYSFLRPLDNIDAPADLALGSYFNEDTFKRLSATLHALADSEHGSKQLPEMPLPEYDNGSTAQAGMKSKSAQNQHQRQVCRSNLNALPPSHLDQPFQTSEPFQSRNQSLRRNKRKSRDISKHWSPSQGRATSLYVGPTAHQLSSHTRTGSDGISTKTNATAPRKKSLTFAEQRYILPGQEGKPSAQTQPTKKKLRLFPSLRDMHRRHNADKPLEQPVKDSPLMSLHEALQDNVRSLPQLHDAEQDRKFTEECTQLLRHGSRCSFISNTPPKPGPQHKVDEMLANMNLKHIHRFSEASLESVSDSILDMGNILDMNWPQPGNRRSEDVRSGHQLARRDSDTIPLCESIMLQRSLSIKSPKSPNTSIPSLWRENSMSKHSPSSPPQRPLPPLPQSHVAVTHPVEPLSMSTIYQCNGVQRIPDNNIRHSTAMKRLLDHDASTPPVSPLKGRFSSSRRSERVNEIRKKHISMLMNDNARLHETMLHAEPSHSGRRGSAPAKTHRISIEALVRSGQTHTGVPREDTTAVGPAPTQNHRRVPSNGSARRTRRTSVDIKGCRTSTRGARVVFSHVSPPKRQVLAQSSIMTLVDSGPNVSHGFSAGAISPRNRKNRKQLKIAVSRAIVFPSQPEDGHSSAGSSARSWPSLAKTEDTELTIPSAHTSADVSLTESFSSVAGISELSRSMDQEPLSVPYPPQLADLGSNSLQPAFGSQQSAIQLPLVQEDHAETTLQDLQTEMNRIRRVYSTMSKANMERSGNGKGQLRFSEMLSADRSTSTTSISAKADFSEQLMNVQKKLEEDLLSSPKNTNSDLDKLPHISSLSGRAESASMEGDDSNVHATSRFHPSLTARRNPSTRSDSKRKSPQQAKSPRLETSQAPAQNKKRYSILSQYNPYPTPEQSPRLPQTQWGPFPTVKVGRTSDTHNIAPTTRHDAPPIYQDVAIPSLTSTRMDSAIAAFNFTAPARRDLDALSAARQHDSPMYDLRWGTDLEETSSQHERRLRRTACS